ncbi:DUF2986 domain-containing protein [Pseudoalteromonas sp. ND6B]|uniref:DUF2986 domain-containing protein n=1 Tax=Pseudoalteromonas sp. ND6B TaxID=1535421 RepID=UPI00051A0722|nr:DUF2986 domain-containing protein [Pseudoalteromonas sp. ND6B]KGJ99267.1 Protein of unknown function DUF2986 [Pseudoalteromonas sp. ND6B]
MNRRKKIVTKFQKKDKRANAKLHKSNKPAYVSKAERAKLAKQDAEQAIEHEANEVVQTSV